MFTWDLLNLLWILVAAFCAGFGWSVGSWLASKILR
jgi:hypothetical protein